MLLFLVSRIIFKGEYLSTQTKRRFRNDLINGGTRGDASKSRSQCWLFLGQRGSQKCRLPGYPDTLPGPLRPLGETRLMVQLVLERTCPRNEPCPRHLFSRRATPLCGRSLAPLPVHSHSDILLPLTPSFWKKQPKAVLSSLPNCREKPRLLEGLSAPGEDT